MGTSFCSTVAASTGTTGAVGAAALVPAQAESKLIPIAVGDDCVKHSGLAGDGFIENFLAHQSPCC